MLEVVKRHGALEGMGLVKWEDPAEVAAGRSTPCLIWRGAIWHQCDAVLHGDLLIVTPRRMFSQVAMLLSGAFVSIQDTFVSIASQAGDATLRLRFMDAEKAAAFGGEARAAAAMAHNALHIADLAEHRQQRSYRSRPPLSPRDTRIHSECNSECSPNVSDAEPDGWLHAEDNPETDKLREELAVPTLVPLVLMSPAAGPGREVRVSAAQPLPLLQAETWPELQPVRPRGPEAPDQPDETVTHHEDSFASKVFRTLGLSPVQSVKTFRESRQSRVAVLRARFQGHE